MLLGHTDITITAKIYTHLLDGDLKVRDEFRFDKSTQIANSENSRSLENQMAETLSKLVTLLADDRDNAVTSEMVARAVRPVLQSVSSNANERQPTTGTLEKGPRATPVLRNKVGSQKNESPGLTTEASSSFDSEKLQNKKMACPIRFERTTFSFGG